jgi:hypothetical protein
MTKPETVRQTLRARRRIGDLGMPDEVWLVTTVIAGVIIKTVGFYDSAKAEAYIAEHPEERFDSGAIDIKDAS